MEATGMKKQYFIVCDKCGKRLDHNKDYIQVQDPESEDLSATKVDLCSNCYKELLNYVATYEQEV